MFILLNLKRNYAYRFFKRSKIQICGLKNHLKDKTEYTQMKTS